MSSGSECTRFRRGAYEPLASLMTSSIYGNTKVEHDRHLYNLMKVVSDNNGLVFNSDKCVIGQERIPLFGIVYDAGGVHQLLQTSRICNNSLA